MNVRLPAEWEPQDAVMLTWPHANTDWAPTLHLVLPSFIHIAREIAKRERLIVVTPAPSTTRQQLDGISNVTLCQMDSNDTWARDHGPICAVINDTKTVLDFRFNAWGLKFPANFDNLITRRLFMNADIFADDVKYVNAQSIVLEGGSIESDGQGTILTTSQCLLSENRNEWMQPQQVSDNLKSLLGAQRLLFLNNGTIDGDDTDGHIDTLARFCSPSTIAYVQLTDTDNEDYYDMCLMEEELKSLRTADNQPYNLIPLPSPDPILDSERPLPATYANFLILNGAVLYPTYRQPDNDALAARQLQQAFPDRDIIGIDCVPVIHQNGSLHCLTMQIPQGFLK